MAHRFLISHDSPVLYITLVTNHRLPVFRTDKLRELACTAIRSAKDCGLPTFWLRDHD